MCVNDRAIGEESGSIAPGYPVWSSDLPELATLPFSLSAASVGSHPRSRPTMVLTCLPLTSLPSNSLVPPLLCAVCQGADPCKLHCPGSLANSLPLRFDQQEAVVRNRRVGGREKQ